MNPNQSILAHAISPEDKPASLYRMFGKTGELLYVGVSLNALSRLDNHRSGKPWWKDVRAVTITPYPSRPLAEDAERAAIINEKPVWNVQIRQPGLPRKPKNERRAQRVELKPIVVNAETVAAARLGLEGMNPRAIRERAGVSQIDMAEMIGVTAAGLSRQESGARKPRPETAVRWYRELLRLETLTAIMSDTPRQ